MKKMTELTTFHTSHFKNCINLVHPSVCECCRKVNRSSVYSGKEIYAVPRKYVKKTFFYQNTNWNCFNGRILTVWTPIKFVFFLFCYLVFETQIYKILNITRITEKLCFKRNDKVFHHGQKKIDSKYPNVCCQEQNTQTIVNY